MLPEPYVAVVLALAVYRLCRLAGWDDFPPVVRVRAWLVGPELVGSVTVNQTMNITNDPAAEPEWRYRRPLVAHLIACAFCLGFWLSIIVYVAWLTVPTVTVYLLVPFALSGIVGIIAKNLDP